MLYELDAIPQGRNPSLTFINTCAGFALLTDDRSLNTAKTILKTVGIDLTLKNCGLLDKVRSGAIEPSSGHQECEGCDARVCSLCDQTLRPNFLRMAAHHLKLLLLKGGRRYLLGRLLVGRVRNW
jgi:hypothetical protein